MAILPILKFPDPRLGQKSAPVKQFDERLKQLCADMLETMYGAPGIGLAAPQVNVHQCVVVIDIDYETPEENPGEIINPAPRIFINPKIISKNGEILFQEGCLSVPGTYEEVLRAEAVVVEYQDLDGNPHKLEAEGLLAVAIQHELDHLEGRLFIDRLSFVKSKAVKRRILKGESET